MEHITFTIKGVAPLIQHNGRMANPADEYARAIKKVSSKRKKVDADYEEMARLEFLGALYVNRENRIIMPSYVLEACLIGKGGAARKERSGKEAAAGLFIQDDSILEYGDNKTPDELWEDEIYRFVAMVKVGQARIARTRPIFLTWGLEFTVNFNAGIVDRESIIRWAQLAGEEVGLCDWRPRYGRFDVVNIE